MLPKRERLTTKDFKQVIENGKTVRSGVLYTKYTPRTDEIKRFAVSVPKKLVKSAVERHFLKRKMMVAIRNVQDAFPFADYIVFATPNILGSRGTVLDSIMIDLANKVSSSDRKQ